MKRGGYRYGGAGGYRGEPSGRNDSGSGRGQPRGGGERGYHHPPQPHNDPSWGDDTRRGRYRDGDGANSPPDPAISSFSVLLNVTQGISPLLLRTGRAGVTHMKVNILDYFWHKYHKNIVYKDIPCLEFGRGVYVLMEFCILVEGQRYLKENLNKNASMALKIMSLAPPEVRQSAIQAMVESSDGPCCGGVVQNFGMEVKTTMTTVLGRIIEPPKLRVGGRHGEIITVTLDPEKCLPKTISNELS